MIDTELYSIARQAGNACGFDVDVEEEDGSVVARTDVPTATPWMLTRGDTGEVKTFLNGMVKGCKSMLYAPTDKGTKRLVNDIEDLLNRGTGDDVVDPMFDGIVRMHRTLQQNFWRVIGDVCDKYAGAPFDARNEGSVKFCKMVKGIGNGKILEEAATDCLEKATEIASLKKKCNDIFDKYKNKTIIGLCKDIKNLTMGSRSCGELSNIAIESDVPFYLPFM